MPKILQKIEMSEEDRNKSSAVLNISTGEWRRIKDAVTNILA